MSNTPFFYYINEEDGRLEPVYKEHGLDYWMCPSDCSMKEFDKRAEDIWKALQSAYLHKKTDGLTLEEIHDIVRYVLSHPPNV
jgi:tyrosyl-tRNA synthetase